MKEKIGKLEKVVKIGLLGTLKIVVDEQDFYGRIRCENMPKNLKEQVRKKVIVKYEETETPLLFDRMIDALFGDFTTPITYNQIKKVELCKEVKK